MSWVYSFAADLVLVLQVVYEKTEGVLISSEVKWAYNTKVSSKQQCRYTSLVMMTLCFRHGANMVGRIPACNHKHFTGWYQRYIWLI